MHTIEPPHGAKRYAYVAFAMLQCFLGAGIIFGWTSILPVLEHDRVYSELCAPHETVCTAQSEQLHYAFTIAGSSSMCSNLILGLFFDRFGPRATKVLSLALLIVGAILMGHAHPRVSTTDVDLLLPGMALLGFAGPGVQLSGIHLSNLFPTATALVTCCIVGALQLSFFVFTLFRLLYERGGVTRATIFDCYALLLILTLAISYIVDPDAPFELSIYQQQHRSRSRASTAEHTTLLSPLRLPTVFNDDAPLQLLASTPELTVYRKQQRRRSRAKLKRKSDDSDSDTDDTDDTGDANSLARRSFKTQVRSTPFVLMCLFFAIEALWCNFFIGSVTTQLRTKSQFSPAVVDALLNDLAIVLPASVVFIPFVGLMIETSGFAVVTGLCASAALGYTVLLTWSTTHFCVVLAFVLYALFRTILFAVLFAYIGQTFGYRHFGALTGIAFCVGAVVGLLQTPITAIDDFEIIGWLEIVSLLATFVLPLYEWRRSRQHSSSR